jgi:hypothetical protein
MSPQFLSGAGLIGLATGLLGALSALVMLLWPPQVAEQLVSYPFTTVGFYVAQAWFFVHHFGLVLALVALALSAALGKSRFARVGAWTAVIGMVALAFSEVLAMRYADWHHDTANAGWMGTSYGIAVTVIGLGMLAAGVGVLRADTWHGWRRWTPLAIGIATFAVVTPGMFGGFVIARLAIGSWLLLLAALGWSIYVESRRLVRAAPPRLLAAPLGRPTT